MAMQHVSKGFLLVDSLITIFISALVCSLCYSIYMLNDKYVQGYKDYQEKSNERLQEILVNLNECETCEVIDESD